MSKDYIEIAILLFIAIQVVKIDYKITFKKDRSDKK